MWEEELSEPALFHSLLMRDHAQINTAFLMILDFPQSNLLQLFLHHPNPPINQREI